MWCVSYRSTLSFTALGRSSSSMIWLTPWSTITWPTDRNAHQRDSTLMCWSREYMHKQHYLDLQTHSTYCSGGTLVMQLRLHLKNTHSALRDSVCVYLFITISERLGCVCRLLSLPPLLFRFLLFSVLCFTLAILSDENFVTCLMHGCTYSSLKYIKRPTNPLCGFPCPTTHIDWWKWCWQCSQTSFDSRVWTGVLAVEPLNVCLMELKMDKNQEWEDKQGNGLGYWIGFQTASSSWNRRASLVLYVCLLFIEHSSFCSVC